MTNPTKKIEAAEISQLQEFISNFSKQELDLTTLRILVSLQEHYYEHGEARTMESIEFIKKFRDSLSLEPVAKPFTSVDRVN